MIDTQATVFRAAMAATTFLLAVTTASAQENHAVPKPHDVTVVTLYSESRPARGAMLDDDKPQRAPIQIVDGGVKSAGSSCWELNESGQIVPVAGECYILRSAAPGEKVPSR